MTDNEIQAMFDERDRSEDAGEADRIDCLIDNALRKQFSERQRRQRAEVGTPNPIRSYIDDLFVSGNSVAVDRAWLGAESWRVIKECLDASIPLDYNKVEAECVYRRKVAAYGEEVRATSPLPELHSQCMNKER